MRNEQGTNIHSDGTKEVGTWRDDKAQECILV